MVDTRFQNKAGAWASSDDWSIYREGVIENTTKNMVLSVISDGTDLGMLSMATWVVAFSNGGYKIRKILA